MLLRVPGKIVLQTSCYTEHEKYMEFMESMEIIPAFERKWLVINIKYTMKYATADLLSQITLQEVY